MRPGVCTAPEPLLSGTVLRKDASSWFETTLTTWRSNVKEILLDASWFSIPPPHRRQGSCARPHLVQRLALVQPPVLHHVMDFLRVVDVVERIRVQHHEIGELAGLERAQVLVHPDAVGAVHRADAQRFAWRHSSARHGPELPMTTQPVELAVAPHADVAAGPEHRGRGCRDAPEHVLILAEPGPALGPLVDLLVGEEAPDLRVVVDVVALVEVVLAERSAVR